MKFNGPIRTLAEGRAKFNEYAVLGSVMNSFGAQEMVQAVQRLYDELVERRNND